MTRLKLFLFYAAMAWLSLVQPREGQKMVDAAERDSKQQALKRLVKDIHQNGRTPPEVQSEPGVGLILFGALAGLSTIGWVCILVSVAIGWSE